MAVPLPTASHDTRESLIEAALACFAKYGYDATSLRLISSMAGKNSSLISYYFKNKEGLYREVIGYLMDRFGICPPNASDWEVGPEIQGGRNRLRSHFHRILSDVEAHARNEDPLRDAAASLFLNELHHPKAETRDLLEARLEPSVRNLRACVRTIRPDLPAEAVDFWGITLQGVALGHALNREINRLLWTSADPDLPLDTMADRLADFAYHGLLGSGESQARPQGENLPGI